ncbi:SLAM family member 5-like [Xenopus laevis]|uniref:SLAM family member 5-like n=1 Tax=Xenopus laevis TaxID=8355 RepID=A0A8J1LK00_XENLA|nr:SLAM family member 5-like [Xenopus laevis]
MSLGYWKLIVLTLLPYCVYSGPCGPTRNITGKEGETATLHVNATGGRAIAWVLVNGTRTNTFAETKPNSSINIRGNQYKGRVSSTNDGSLIFTHLTKKVQGIYRAEVSKSDCSHFYSLKVYKSLVAEDIQIHHNRSESCNVILSCTVNERDVTISWSHTDRTGPTLHVYNVSDAGVYTCTAHNPISSASKSLTLTHICYNGKHSQLYYLTGLILVPVIVCPILCFIWIFMRKRRKKTVDQNAAGEIQGQTVYSEVENYRTRVHMLTSQPRVEPAAP